MATIKQLNLNNDSFFGLKFPLEYNSSDGGFFPRARTITEQATSNLKNLILTNKGERVGQPDFGCNVTDFLFEQIAEDSFDLIETSIKDAIEQWLPYVTIANLIVNTNNQNPNAVFIVLEFTVDAEDPNSIQTLTFNFNTGM